MISGLDLWTCSSCPSFKVIGDEESIKDYYFRPTHPPVAFGEIIDEKNEDQGLVGEEGESVDGESKEEKERQRQKDAAAHQTVVEWRGLYTQMSMDHAAGSLSYRSL